MAELSRTRYADDLLLVPYHLAGPCAEGWGISDAVAAFRRARTYLALPTGFEPVLQP